MNRIEILKQAVAEKRQEKKQQLRTAFILILERVNKYPVTIEKIVDELLREVSIRTPLN